MKHAYGMALTLILLLSPLVAQSTPVETIIQLAEVEFNWGVLYVSIVRRDGEPLEARLLAADPESMTAVTMTTTDVDKLLELQRAIDLLITELQDDKGRKGRK